MIPTSLPLHVLILTHNEERHIARAIRSVAPFARYVTLVDSFSSDRTVEIAQSLGATVLQRPWINYADQFSWGLAQITDDAEWIMRLDADEVIEPDLSERILEDLPKLDAGVVGINIDRKHIFMG
ncbi:MAG: glycosyl transferase, partial [Azorhizobium sp. 12-66-6]